MSSDVTSNNGTAVGYNASSSASAAAVGYNSTASGSGALSIGPNSQSSGAESIALGQNAVGDGSKSISIGRECDSQGFGHTICMGFRADAEATGQVIIGNSSVPYTDFYLGGILRHSMIPPADINLQPSRRPATGNGDKNGADFNIKTGTSSGIGEGGSFRVYTAETGTVATNAENSTHNLMIHATSSKELVMTANTIATADVSLHAGSVSFYLDETGNNLVVKTKYSDGITIKTGTIPLL